MPCRTTAQEYVVDSRQAGNITSKGLKKDLIAASSARLEHLIAQLARVGVVSAKAGAANPPGGKRVEPGAGAGDTTAAEVIAFLPHMITGHTIKLMSFESFDVRWRMQHTGGAMKHSWALRNMVGFAPPLSHPEACRRRHCEGRAHCGTARAALCPAPASPHPACHALPCCTIRRPLAHMQRPTSLLAVHESTADNGHKTGTAACPCPKAGQRSKGSHLLIVQEAPTTGIAQTQLYHLALVDVEALRQRSS